MREEGHEYISIIEFSRRLGVQRQAVQYAIKRGRIVLSGEMDGKSKLIDWTTQSKVWQTNRQTEARHYTKKNADGTPKKYNKVERHIGDSEVYETGQMGIDPSFSRFDNIPDIDNIQAPEGSVAYYQAKKIAIDALRNLNKLKLETAQLIIVADAISLYCDSLTQVSDMVQTIPSRISSLIVAQIRKSVEKWKLPPDNLESEVFRMITLQCKDVLNEIAKKIENSDSMTQDFIDETVTGKK